MLVKGATAGKGAQISVLYDTDISIKNDKPNDLSNLAKLVVSTAQGLSSTIHGQIAFLLYSAVPL